MDKHKLIVEKYGCKKQVALLNTVSCCHVKGNIVSLLMNCRFASREPVSSLQLRGHKIKQPQQEKRN